MTITCRTECTPGAPGRRHPVVVHRDWSVEVPHDLDGERLAIALGGYVTCVELVDLAVPALRLWVERAARLEPPAMAFVGEVDRWRLLESDRCCPPAGFRDALAAAEHWRSPTHVAARRGASARQVAVLAQAATRAHAGAGSLAIPPADRDRAAAACCRGGTDVAWLWEAGIHPALVWRIHEQLGGPEPLPARFYLGVVWNRPDLQWVADTIAGRDDPQEVHGALTVLADAWQPKDIEPLASWLAWSAANWDVVQPSARRRWLETGISRALILALGEAGYDPDEVMEHARAVDRTPEGVARTIRDWLDAGYHPEPASLTALHGSGLHRFPVPARSAVCRLRQVAGHPDAVWSDTDLALLLAEHGTVPHALAALRAGGRPC